MQRRCARLRQRELEAGALPGFSVGRLHAAQDHVGFIPWHRLEFAACKMGKNPTRHLWLCERILHRRHRHARGSAGLCFRHRSRRAHDPRQKSRVGGHNQGTSQRHPGWFRQLRHQYFCHPPRINSVFSQRSWRPEPKFAAPSGAPMRALPSEIAI